MNNQSRSQHKANLHEPRGSQWRPLPQYTTPWQSVEQPCGLGGTARHTSKAHITWQPARLSKTNTAIVMSIHGNTPTVGPAVPLHAPWPRPCSLEGCCSSHTSAALGLQHSLACVGCPGGSQCQRLACQCRALPCLHSRWTCSMAAGERPSAMPSSVPAKPLHHSPALIHRHCAVLMGESVADCRQLGLTAAGQRCCEADGAAAAGQRTARQASRSLQ